MTLNWNEIKDRALTFTREWAGTHSEDADAKPFLQAFFNIFGVGNRRFGNFEFRVKKLDNKDGYIDLLWAGVIMVEMKSRGKSLEKAYEQAREYTFGLKEHELPQCILVSDFDRFRLYDLDNDTQIEFCFEDLIHNVQHFGFLMGYQKRTYHEQDIANVKAAELMGKLHDRLAAIGYLGHSLEVYLVRVLFCLFAEDTSIFTKQQFQDYIFYRTNEDGSDLAARLQELFQVLNTPEASRFKNIDEELAAFPYINGRLFEENLPTASFDSKMRLALLDCCYFDWSKISPAIFGSMFQSVMNPTARRNLGAHYTSESNILKVIKPLFLDELWAEFEKVKNNNMLLEDFHKKIAKLRFLDPACGCGNFLIVTYRELRLLELQVLLRLQYLFRRYEKTEFINISMFFKVNVDQFFGIEYEEFPARIAEVAMWLIDHQMNLVCSIETGKRLFRIPLVKSANIVHGNSLQIDWQSILVDKSMPLPLEYADMVQRHFKKDGTVEVEYFEIVDEDSEIKPYTKFDYILGNPPFIGSRLMSKNQKEDLQKCFDHSKDTNELDYVTAWYVKAAKYSQNTKSKVAFVSTNSITQGEQVGILWNYLMNKLNMKIHFAHRTFKWANEGKHNAAVYCVIIGFAYIPTNKKRLFDYENIKGEAHEIEVKNINPYLIDAKDILITKKRTPICHVPKIVFGNMPNDGGHLLFTDQEKEAFLEKEPQAEKYIKPMVSAREFLNNERRWCLWLVGVEAKEYRQYPEIMKRVNAVQKYREASTREATKKLAQFSALFGEIRQPSGKYILIPRVSSENRRYIPMGFFDDAVIVSDTCLSVNSTANLFHFGILQSTMHMAWVKSVCGRLKSDFRYSNEIVYNNFPFPENPSEKQIKKIEEKAQVVLDARAKFPNSSLADMYDPVVMPPDLVKAHNALDKAVDLAYRPQVFVSEANRMEFLFELYERYTAGFFAKEKKKRKK